MRKRNELILKRDAATVKIKPFYISSHPLTFSYCGFLFVPATILPQINFQLSLQSAPAAIVKHHLRENLSCFLKVAPPNDLYSQTTLAAKIATASPSGIPIDRIGRQVRHLASTETPLRD